MVTLAVGTEKGGWLLRSRDRDAWEVSGPLFPGWRVTALGRAPGGTYLAGVASDWFGPAVHRSRDLADWEQVVHGPSFPEGGDRTLNEIWTIQPAGEAVWAGVDEAGLFRSTDDGASWAPVAGFNDRPDRDVWMPGAGGLCAHRVLAAGDRLWVGVSAVGVLRSEDRGVSFRRADGGMPTTVSEADGAPAAGFCVHGLVADPDDPDRIWRQDHLGVFRTADGGDHWERVEAGLPGAFGFPVVRDHATGRLFVVPLHSDQNRVPVDGRFRVYCSDDDGDSWRVAGTGWPDGPTYTIVLRGAMTTDGLDPCGVYAGTTSGAVWGSVDGGEAWRRLPGTFPRILAVAAFPDT